MILRIPVKGKKANEIALDLGIGSKTVSIHKIRLMSKMHIDSEVKSMQYIIMQGRALYTRFFLPMSYSVMNSPCRATAPRIA